jgi:hypothetical protein
MVFYPSDSENSMKSTAQELTNGRAKRNGLSSIPSENAVKRYRVSGHESFPFRYAWLPKIIRLLGQDHVAFNDDETLMVELGLGKNMVRSARFWAQATGVINATRDGVEITPFGHAILSEGGFDPYLEDINTLWLLHWQLSTNTTSPLLAWDILFNRWQEPEIISSLLVKRLENEVSRHYDKFSSVTIKHHVDAFFHTYIPTRGNKGRIQEDNLDCPLIELELLQKNGERESTTAKNGRESIYSFRYDDKPDITIELFTYCLAEYWEKQFPNEQTLSFRNIAYGHGSLGQVFKMPEDSLRARIENIGTTSKGYFDYSESIHVQQVHKTNKSINPMMLLQNVYKGKTTNGG